MRRRKNRVLPMLLGMMVLLLVIPCVMCGVIGMLLPSGTKHQPPIQEAKGITPDNPLAPEAEVRRTLVDGAGDAKKEGGLTPLERKDTPAVVQLDVMPRVMPTAEDEEEADVRVKMARSFMSAKNYQTAKEVLVYVIGEFPGTRAIPTANKMLEVPELVVIVVPPHVKKPRPDPPPPKAVVQLPPAKKTVEHEVPHEEEVKRIGFIPVPDGGGKTVNVRGYYRKDGTYVRPHTRHAPRR